MVKTLLDYAYFCKRSFFSFFRFRRFLLIPKTDRFQFDLRDSVTPILRQEKRIEFRLVLSRCLSRKFLPIWFFRCSICSPVERHYSTLHADLTTNSTNGPRESSSQSRHFNCATAAIQADFLSLLFHPIACGATRLSLINVVVEKPISRRFCMPTIRNGSQIDLHMHNAFWLNTLTWLTWQTTPLLAIMT